MFVDHVRLGVLAIGAIACGRLGFEVPPDAPPPCLPTARVAPSGGEAQAPVIARIGGQLAIAWQSNRDDGTFTATVSLIAADGSVTNVELPCGNRPSYFGAYRPAIAASASVYGVAWGDSSSGVSSSRLWFAILGTDGAVRAGPTAVDSGFVGQPSLVWTGSAFVVAYSSNPNDPPTAGSPAYVNLARFAEDGAVLGPPTRLSDDTSRVTYPALVWTGATLLAAWEDGRNSTSDAYVGAAAPDGTKLAPDVRLGTVPGHVGIAWNGNTALLAYGDAVPHLQLHSLDANGTVIATHPTQLPLYDPSPAWDGQQWLVLGTEQPGFVVSLVSVDTMLVPAGMSTPVWRHSNALPRLAWLGDRSAIAVVDTYEYPFDLYLTEVCVTN